MDTGDNHTVLVIFGSTGNLVQKKLMPALYHLERAGMIPDDYTILCVARQKNATVETITAKLDTVVAAQGQQLDSAVKAKLLARIQLVFMDSTKKADFALLKRKLQTIDEQHGVYNQRLFYLAIPPNIFGKVIENLAAYKLNDETNAASRILVEKPFGTDLASAQELIDYIANFFAEHQVYRIDHYLAKETAQNILTFRHSNPIIEDIWGRQFIDHIQITAAETIDIEGRANFYEGMGALRDLVQSHLLQLMALTLMEVPDKLTSEAIHNEKLSVLRAVKPIKPSHVNELVVRGQYKGYASEAQLPDSAIETYVALQLEVANSRWGGVPILLRTGKALADKRTEIQVVFKDRSRRNAELNILTIRIQPNEGIAIMLQAKKPGFKHELQPVHMNFSYQNSFSDWQPDAYERVLVDAMQGDQTLFASGEEVIACWNIIQPILDAWHRQEKAHPKPYAKGSWGPKKADELAGAIGFTWLNS